MTETAPRAAPAAPRPGIPARGAIPTERKRPAV